MLLYFIIACFICWIVGFFINGFTLYNVLILVPTIMFSVRKVGIRVKASSILTMDVLFLVFSVLWRLLFKNFLWGKFLLTLLVRFIFTCIVFYDDTAYVYITEERKQ